MLPFILGDAVTTMIVNVVTPLVNDLKLIAFALLGLEIVIAGLTWAASSFIGGQMVMRAKEALVHALVGTAIVAVAAQFATIITTALGG